MILIDIVNLFFGVLNEFLIRKGFTSMKDIFNYVEDNKSLYLKKSYPNNEVWYQSRIGGFLAERLLNIFVMKNFERVKSIGIVITEDKYGKNDFNHLHYVMFLFRQ